MFWQLFLKQFIAITISFDGRPDHRNYQHQKRNDNKIQAAPQQQHKTDGRNTETPLDNSQDNIAQKHGQTIRDKLGQSIRPPGTLT